ncbi:hypothetical protein Peur_040704 [Populus x canadensis]
MDKDVTGRFMPSLAYVSREKSKASNHHFEAGAQNVLEPGASFTRQVFCGGPSKFESPAIPELNPNHVVDKSIRSSDILALAHHPSGCNYEKQTSWGYKASIINVPNFKVFHARQIAIDINCVSFGNFQIGYRYGSLVEDYFAGSRLHSEGWRSIFCNPGGCTRFLVGSAKTVDCWCS